MSSHLISYAITESISYGRQYPEKPHPYRDDFDRDRDRIIHCSAFRRLEGKTQVFTPGLDDYYRTRLTHSIEVAQIGRTIARALGLNQSLTEAICLAHDLGHPPFGHAGEKFLNELMTDFGGFEHNKQSLRIVDLLEHPYPDFMGLNLMYETRLALARHKSRYDKPSSDDFPQLNCSLEGQIADIADRIAYNCHDLEDGMRAGLIDTEELKTVELFVRAQNRINAERISDKSIQRTRTAKLIIDDLVSDCIVTTIKNLDNKKFKSLKDIYNEPADVVIISKESEALLVKLEDFLLKKFYMHDSLSKAAERIKLWLSKLFDCLCKNPKLMPGYFQRFIAQHGTERVVCDYIAGMTDRYCLKSLEKITGT